VAHDLGATLRTFRVKLYGLEVLLEVEGGRRTQGWFAGIEPPIEERGEATLRLVEHGLLESRPAPEHFLLTDAGRRLLANVRAKIAPGGHVDWTRIDEIDFRLL